MTETEKALAWLGGLYLLAKYWDAVPAIERGGAAVYDALHDDAGHKRDLPGHQLTKDAVLALATRAGFADPKLAAAIAMAESGGVPGARVRSSREDSVGLWQINLLAHPSYDAEQMKDPEQNALAALDISRGGTDWRPWSAFKNGAYKRWKTGVLA